MCWYDRGIYGTTPAEIVHDVLLRLCEYIAEGIELTFTASATHSISHVVVSIYTDSQRQRERDMPDLGPF